jgi:hopene-associated glycosyltransferase HpnB
MIHAAAAIAVVIWATLLVGRGYYWLCRENDRGPIVPPEQWPSVTAVIPARDEADVIATSLASLLAQDYPGRFSIVLVDDNSSDGTAAVAKATAEKLGRTDRVRVISGRPLPGGWTGKLWAVHQGVTAAEDGAPDYLLLTDADIMHAPDSVKWLTAHAARGGYVLTSLMAKLRCVSLAEQTLVPAFVYFFQMLYPFAWVADPQHRTAAAAGGCVLVKADALRDSGGIEGIRGALIDDCTLARALKRQGPIWLGLTERVVSLRPYPAFADVKAMVSRSAYAQLRYSPLLLLGTVLGMAMTFLLPPLLAIFASGAAQVAGLLAWAAMAMSMTPMLIFYRLPSLWGVALPGIALLYTYYTLNSAWQHWRKRGGQWKGRVYADVPGAQ